MISLRKNNPINGQTSVIYDAIVTADIALPLVSDVYGEPLRSDKYSKVRIQCCPGELGEFTSAKLSSIIAERKVRSYDVPQGLLICYPADLRVLVERSGRLVTLDYDKSSNEASGTAISISVNMALAVSALLRRRIPLHAAGVSIEGRSVGFLAPSGTGKSTLLSYLLGDGAVFLSDDVIVIDRIGNEMVCFPSCMLHAKLDKDMAERRCLRQEDLTELIPGSEEYWCPVSLNDRIINPSPLHCLFYLKPQYMAPDPAYLVMHQAQKGEYLNILMANTQGLNLAQTIIDGWTVIRQFEDIAATTPLFVVEYARSLHIIPSLARLIKQTSAMYSGQEE
jgi:hypothetical protein